MPVDALDLIPGFAFWRDGCRTFAKNVCKVLALANKDKDFDSRLVFEFLRTLPRSKSDLSVQWWLDGYCQKCLKKACENASPAEVEALTDYFLFWFPERDRTSQTMLIDAMVGLVSGIDEAVNEVEEQS